MNYKDKNPTVDYGKAKYNLSRGREEKPRRHKIQRYFDNTDVPYWIWVVAFSFFGGLFKYLDQNPKKNPNENKSYKDIAIRFFKIVGSSMFVGYCAFELVLYMTDSFGASLAANSLASYLGGDWIKRKLNKATDAKIDALKKDSSDYDTFEERD